MQRRATYGRSLGLDHPAGHPGACRTGRLRSEIVGLSMNDHGLSEDRVLFSLIQTQEIVGFIVGRDSVIAGLQVAQVADMMDRRRRRSMVDTGWIEVTARTRSIGSAAVTIFMNVEAMLPRCQPRDSRSHVHT